LENHKTADKSFVLSLCHLVRGGDLLRFHCPDFSALNETAWQLLPGFLSYSLSLQTAQASQKVSFKDRHHQGADQNDGSTQKH
jgi:hypothetical protein